MPHSSKLHRQRDGEGKGCDGGAGALHKGEEKAGRDWPPGAPGQLDPAKAEAAAPEGGPPGERPRAVPRGLPPLPSPGNRIPGEREKQKRIYCQT